MIWKERESEKMEYTAESIDKLVADLQGEDESTRTTAAFALVLLGSPAVPPLANLLDHGNPDIRMRAAWALGVIGSPAIPRLLELSESEDQRVRKEAIRVLGVIGEARTLNHLLSALTDPDAHVAARAARAIGKIGDPRAFHPLVTALRHPEPDVRYEVCRALADLHIAEAVDSLHELAERETAHTTWGESVADVARQAAADVGKHPRLAVDEDFQRISQLLKQHTTGTDEEE